MPEMRDLSAGKLDPAQAAELAQLVELEARWENLRNRPSRPAEVPPALQDLHGKQKAYEAFRTRLAAYNKRYGTVHVSELLLNTPVRLGTWCRAMRELFARVEADPRGVQPIQLLEKAYRWADRVAVRTGIAPLGRPAAPVTLATAAADLDTLARWCDELAQAAPLQAQAG